MEELTETLDPNGDVDIKYLDLKKAFDKVPHKRLLKKIWGYGIRGKVYSWIKEFLKKQVTESSDKTNWTNLYPLTKGYLRETCKSQNINPIYLTLSSPSVLFRS